MRLVDLYESQLNEIERLTKDMYTGGKKELEDYKQPSAESLKKLPGGSGLLYALATNHYGGTNIFILDPKAATLQPKPTRGAFEYKSDFQIRLKHWQDTKDVPQPKIVAKLSVDNYSNPIPNSVQVGSITVDEDYRGMGLAKALYGIVLTIMKKTLIAGDSQTPGGRRNWMSLAYIPGVEIKGFVQVDDDAINFNPNDYGDEDSRYAKSHEHKVDKVHDIIMQLGGQFIGKNNYSEFWAFDVMPGNGELVPAVKTTLSKLYTNSGYEQTGLFAKWTGK